MKILFLVFGIVLAAAGLLLALAIPVAGLLFAALGVAFIVYSRKIQKKIVQEALPDDSNKKTIKVAGISNYMDAVMEFAAENDEYNYTKQQIIKEGMEDEEIYEYVFRDLPVKFEYEPDNEYDSNAIAIYIASLKIGYVPKEDIEFIRSIIDAGTLKSAICEFVGGNYKIYNSDEETLEKHELNIGARVTVSY